MFLNIIFLHVFKSNDFQVLIFGDSNFPDVNWDAHKSIHSDEQFLLDYLSQDPLLEQIIRSSTHKRGNILVFVSHSDLWDYVILNSSCSDHNPIIIKYAQRSFSASISSDYSVTSFNNESLNTHLYQVLHVAYKLIIFSLTGSQILIMPWPLA